MNIFLAVPTYSNTLSLETHRSMIAAHNLPEGVGLIEAVRGSSLLCLNFNMLWCDALNRREKNDLRWFVMLHGDMGSPDLYWLNNLLALAEQHELDALSVISPIKDSSGEVSTALCDDWETIRRLTLQELAGWPETFSAEWVKEKTNQTLLINTGMLALRLDRDWCEEFHWTITDSIQQTIDGKFIPHTLSEDWNMSLWFAERGIPYGATRAIPTVHAGAWTWTNEVKPCSQ